MTMWWLWAATRMTAMHKKRKSKVANYLRQSGMAAQAQIIESAGRLRVAVLALNNPAKACCGVYAKDRTKMLGD